MMQRFFTNRPVWFDGMVLIRVFTAVMIFPYALELFNPASMKDLQAFLTDIHWPRPIFFSYVAKLVELIGAVLLALGLFTRLVTIPLMFNMVVVIKYMAGGDIFNDQAATLFLILFLTCFLTGPGKLSLDYLVFGRKKESHEDFAAVKTKPQS